MSTSQATFSQGHATHCLARWFGLASLALAFIGARPAEAAEPTNAPSQLSLERIFNSTDFDGAGTPAIVWSRRHPAYFTLESPAHDAGGKDLVQHHLRTGQSNILVHAHAFRPSTAAAPLALESFTFSHDEAKLLLYTASQRVWRQNTRGDYWVMDLGTRELRRLGGDAKPSSLMFAQFSPDGHRVAYVRENNLYVEDLRSPKITALTTDGSATLINGTFDWVYEEELDLRAGFRWSPDSRHIAYWQIDDTGVREIAWINNTDGLYPKVIQVPYPKVGEQNPAARIGVVPAGGGETRWMKIPGDPRNHYLARMGWCSNQTELIVQQFNRLQNTNRVWLADSRTGATRACFSESDATWLENENPERWIDQGKTLVWLSEQSGWRHAYAVSRKDGQRHPITQGAFDVLEILSVDDTGGWLYFLASPDNPTQRYLYRARLDGSKTVRLTPNEQPGWHSYQMSPDHQWAIHTHSSFLEPPRTDLIQLPDHSRTRTLVDNAQLRERVQALDRPSLTFLRVDPQLGVELDAWMLTPPAFDAGRKYPVLFYVYGEPFGQTVKDAWGGKNHLWHLYLAQQGAVVISVDNRGTLCPRGRAFRKSVYRQVGLLGPSDQAAAAAELLRRFPYLDEKRVGIWGWSGGGSSSLHAIFRFPQIYRTAIAVAAVPNQRHYDTIYQERYMGLPDDNTDGYRLGSPITYAHQLKGSLLLIHGTADDNCHYQGAEALAHELIAHQKQFSMMAYPNRTHSISEGPTTTRHLYELFTRQLERTLWAR